ncbi:alpha/beta fold hydrolase [Marilutibacter alkalisoli]|uniref:Alpha/beta hydrolase n=1 Tax=Marilutibacter alkalisoli TaxID=2591633 RepID=A0A514BSE5_9GAMM|nr:alpha/beta hydrolase [Lysobacter alkalisoli]QDH70322.1 alpha/beta hydrolase [Lysobacter alkalisoli]
MSPPTSRGLNARSVTRLAALALAVLSLLVYIDYRKDLRQAQARVATGSRIADTACGPIEYAAGGRGPAVMVVHGAGGGFDQGMLFSDDLVDQGYRVIAMSRFGYLRTPMPEDASAVAQAEAHACLLDALKIDSAALIGVSAGAPSAVQFALRHPARTTALVLLVPAIYAPRPGNAPPLKTPSGTRLLFDTALRSDFRMWAGLKVARRSMIDSILATPPEVVAHASSNEQMRAAQLLDMILPVSRRREGLINDAEVTSHLPRYELERIVAPTLAISVRDDQFGTFDGARYSASHIPNARFVGFENGGHVWIGHQQAVVAELSGFLLAEIPRRD